MSRHQLHVVTPVDHARDVPHVEYSPINLYGNSDAGRPRGDHCRHAAHNGRTRKMPQRVSAAQNTALRGQSLNQQTQGPGKTPDHQLLPCVAPAAGSAVTKAR
jgi:hypothetical protein